ncbi:acyl-CoA thioesterase [Bacillus sp. 1P02SD]|uniref:acyl-CoA thioesterase n=1 Tax=Bacillus sp. 1P02SD TaxID=3132264 RepID=UPI0039A3434E
MFSKKIRIQFVDTDLTQRIHYSSIFRFFETLDHEFFKDIGYSYTKLFELGFELPRVHVECNYMGNIVYDDELVGQISIAKIGNSSFTYSIQFFKGEQLAIRGSMTIVFITTDGKKVAIPDFVKKELEKHLEPVNVK